MLTYGLTAEPIRRPLDECPFCNWQPNGKDLTDHIARCHPERIHADAAYRTALAQGQSIEVARATYNAILTRAVQRTEGHKRTGGLE